MVQGVVILAGISDPQFWPHFPLVTCPAVPTSSLCALQVGWQIHYLQTNYPEGPSNPLHLEP